MDSTIAFLIVLAIIWTCCTILGAVWRKLDPLIAAVILSLFLGIGILIYHAQNIATFGR